MPFPAMLTPIKCPNCGHSYVTEVRAVIDVGETPELKESFLRGQVNYARCPQCGAGGMLSLPLLYHDPARELLVTYVPAELGLSADEQERYVGSLVQAVMNSLPAEERKGYFLQPKSALTLESLMDTVLEAEGISREILEAQRAQLRLVGELEAAVDDDETLDKLVAEHRARLDYGFFLLLSGLIDAQQEEGSAERADALAKLRDKLLERVTPEMPRTAPPNAGYDELIEILRDAQEKDVWRRTVALNRPRLDYGFFQALTGRIEAAEASGDSERAKELTTLRERVLDEIDAQDRLIRQAEDRASLLIMTLSEASDLRAEVNEHLDEIDDLFYLVLSRYLAAAQSKGDASRAAKLRAIMDATLEAVEERLPPDLRLINRLARAESEEQTNEILEAHRGLLSNEFLEKYDRYVQGIDPERDGDLVAQMRRTRELIVAKMTILRA